MTTYGTIPTAPGSRLEFLSQAKDRAKSALSTRRPWKEMVHRHAFGFPSGFGDSYMRARTNLAYFRMNYAIIVLVILFLSLLWHPISLIVFVVMAVIWLFLYFLRDQPLSVFGRTINDTVVLVVLAVVTIVVLLLTRVTLNVVVAIVIGIAIVLAHALMRKTDDLFVDEEAAAGGAGMYSVVVDPVKRPLNEPSASSSS